MSWEVTPLYFLTQTWYTLVKSSPLKCKVLRLSSSRVKIVKFLMSIFKWQVNYSSDFPHSSVSLHNIAREFLAHEFSTLDKRISWKYQFWHFQFSHCFDENLPYSSCHFPNNKSIFLQILHHSSVTCKSSVHFWVKRYILCTGRTNKSANFSDALVLGSKFIKSLSFLKQKVYFSSNFSPIFSIMRHHSSVPF